MIKTWVFEAFVQQFSTEGQIFEVHIIDLQFFELKKRDSIELVL